MLRKLIAAAVLSVCLGCGSGISNYPVAISPQLKASASAHGIGSVMNFGDSITCGYAATPNVWSGYVYSPDGYANLLDSTIGAPSQNLCRGGDQAADMAALWVYPHARPTANAHQLFTVMIGTNDANACGDSGGCLANYKAELAASLAWLALPPEDKTLAADIGERSGTWIPENTLHLGLRTNQFGASLSFPVTQTKAGRNFYLAFEISDDPNANGSADVFVDGAKVAFLGPPPGRHLIRTQNWTTSTVALCLVPLGDVGTHKVVVRTNSPSGFTLFWAGVSSAEYAGKAGAPRVLLGKITSSPDYGQASRVEKYNEVLSSLVASLKADGLAITAVPTDAALLPAFDFVDNLHPNERGHVKIATAFAASL